jgi:glycosyltransferase involved in cell wall biosynthesis
MQGKKAKVMIVQKGFSHYRRPVFDLLDSEVDLLLVHARSSSGVKQTTASYAKQVPFVKYWKKPTNVFLHIFPQIRRFKPDVVVHEFTPSIVSLFLLFLLRKYFGFKIILWGHVINRKKKVNDERLSWRLRKYLINKSDAVLFYTNTNKNIIAKKLPSPKYFIANNALNTILHQKYFIKFYNKGKENIKRELNLNCDYYLIFIGRLLEEKLLPELFAEMISVVQKQINSVGVIIIGDGPAKPKLNECLSAKNIANVKCLGAIHDEELTGKYLFACDLMLMPGYIGLAANHAFSYRTPVVTFQESPSGPFHSPEIEYVKHEKTGFLANPFETIQAGQYIIDYIKSDTLKKKMTSEIETCLKHHCGLGKMKQGFMDAISFCLKNNE